MGEIIVRKVKGMNWKSKISLVLIFTMLGVLAHQVYYAYAAISSARMVYNNNSTTPQARTYTVTTNTFSAAGATVAGATPSWVKVISGTVRDEAVVAYVGTDNTLRIMYWNGSSWSSAAPHNWTAALGASGSSGRGFDVAVEQLSGDIVVAYTTNAAGTEINSYRWNGSTWTGPTPYDSARLTGTVRFIKMASKPNSDDIGLIMADTNNDLSAAIWNGTTNAFGNPPSAALSTSAAFITAGTVDAQSFDLEYEQQSGNLLVVWANDAIATGIFYNTFSASTGAWGTTAQNTNITEAIEHLDCSSDPLSDSVLCAFVGTAAQDLRVGVWSGTAWQGSTTDVDTTAAPTTFVAGRKYLATGWLNAGSAKQGIVVYNDNNANAINWITVNSDGSFAVQTDNTAATPMPVGGIAYHDIIMDPYNPDRLLFIFQDTTNFDIFAKRLVMDSAGAFTWSDANGGAVIDANPTTAASQAFHLAYDLYYALTVGDGSAVANLTVGPSTTNNALDSFTMQMRSGSGSISSLVVTGSTNFTATNIPTNGVKVWRDLGTIGAYDPGVDVQISTASTAIAGNATTVTISPAENISTTTANCLVTVDITATPTNAQSFTGTVTAVTGVTGVRYQDTSSATLTVSTAAANLSVGNGTNPINKNAPRSSTNNALDSFTMGMTRSSLNSTVSSLVVTGSANFTATNIPTNGVKVWRDTGTAVGYWDSGDTLISTASTAIASNATTVTISPAESITLPAKNYLVTVDITAGATNGQSFTARVTSVTGANLGTITYGDSSSATLTINNLPSTNTSCGSCHEHPPLDGTRSGASGAVVGNHQVHQYVCSTCHVAPATETSADYGHRDGNIQMQASISGGTYSRGTSFAQTNNPTTGVCFNVSCHGNQTSPQWGVGTAGCPSCHSGTITRTKGVPGGTLSAVASEFGLAWGHKKAGRGAVTSADCIVCHLEGNFTTQQTSSYHADGNIDLRDPDGTGETPITNISGGAFTMTKFAVSFAAGSRTSTGHISNTDMANVITQKFCLACHDSNGAANTTARSNNGGTGTAAMPFGGINLGANYTVANGAMSAGGLVDVKTQLSYTGASAHPVTGPLNRDYPVAANMADPYKPTGTRGTSGTLSQSVVMNCFDCHNVVGTALTTRTVAAHGNAVTVRGQAAVSGTPTSANATTLCTICHLNVFDSASSSHGPNSAFNDSGRSEKNPYLQWGCNVCHSSTYSPVVARPVKAQDVHGNNVVPTGSNTKTGRWAAATKNFPVAFIRNSNQFVDHAPRSITGTTYTPVCMGGSTGDANCTRTTIESYTVGGTY